MLVLFTILFFLMAVVPLFTGVAYIRFTGPISKETAPKAYWAVVLFWFAWFLWAVFAVFDLI